MGAVAKLYMRNGLLIYEELSKYLVIYEEALPGFLLYEESFVFFFASTDRKNVCPKGFADHLLIWKGVLSY